MTERTTAATERPSDPSGRAVLDSLVRARGLDRFAYFFVTGEGTFFPNGMEDASGSVIDDRGRIFDFWTTWDGETNAATFETWEQVEPEPHWTRSAEYRRAREAVGLPH